MTHDMKHNDMKRNNDMRDTMSATRKHHGSCGRVLRTLLLLVVIMTGGATGAWGKDNIKPADSKASGCSETWLRVKTEALPSITGAKVDILFETTK